MAGFALASGYALFVWWFSTGVIILLDNLSPRTFKWSMCGATAVLALALAAIGATRDQTSVAGAYAAFTAALLAWGWNEISFYTGTVTGPRNRRCPEGCSGLKHFGHAIAVSLYHEIAVLAGAAAVFALAWRGTNHVAVWTYAVLWWMHQSARLNVMLGVRNCNEHFLPPHLDFLRSFLRRAPMNLLFPVSVTASTVVAVVLFQRAFATGADAFAAVSFTFLGVLMALAIAEHWFLMVPLDFAALWRWSVRGRETVETLRNVHPAAAPHCARHDVSARAAELRPTA